MPQFSADQILNAFRPLNAPAAVQAGQQQVLNRLAAQAQGLALKQAQQQADEQARLKNELANAGDSATALARVFLRHGRVEEAKKVYDTFTSPVERMSPQDRIKTYNEAFTLLGHAARLGQVDPEAYSATVQTLEQEGLLPAGIPRQWSPDVARQLADLTGKIEGYWRYSQRNGALIGEKVTPSGQVIDVKTLVQPDRTKQAEQKRVASEPGDRWGVPGKRAIVTYQGGVPVGVKFEGGKAEDDRPKAAYYNSAMRFLIGMAGGAINNMTGGIEWASKRDAEVYRHALPHISEAMASGMDPAAAAEYAYNKAQEDLPPESLEDLSAEDLRAAFGFNR